MAHDYYKQCKEFDICNELIHKYGNTKEFEKCFEGHLKLAEETSYPLAECQVGYFYLEGIGVTKDLNKALYWTERSAIHGDRDGQCNLAFIYENGIGVEVDIEKAKNWYHKAALQDHDIAMEKCRQFNIILVNIEFKKRSEFNRGIMVELLTDAYSFNTQVRKDFLTKWIDDDNFFFENPQIADKCCFITCLNGIPIGFIAWDPRNLPSYVIIGDNCIITKYKGKGYGKLQLKEAISRIMQMQCKRIIVSTNSSLISAQKNYESIGFKLVNRKDNNSNLGDELDYELNL